MSTGDGICGGVLFGTGDDADPIGNLGFETGSNGVASRWRSANFTASALVPVELANGDVAESFETGWENTPYVYSFTDAMLILGVVDSFEIGWENTGYLFTTFGAVNAPLQPSTFGATAPTVESFEFGWENDAFAFALTTSPYSYDFTDDGLGVTDFGDGAITQFNPGDLAAPSLSATRALAYEGFEFVKFPQAYTAIAGSGGGAGSLGTAAAHGLAIGQRVVLSSPDASGSMPTPLVAAFDYYVVSVPSPTTFTVSTSSGGAAVTITSSGGGLLTFTAPYEYWVTPSQTL